MAKKEILLESGTNELEILEFTIGDNSYGINVSKISELMKRHEITPMPNSNPYVEGVFKPRDVLMTLINLPVYLGHGESENKNNDIFIITHFNKSFAAFRVHGVEEIHRISWSNIEKPDAAIYGGEEALATGIARMPDKLITILDFEKILSDISPASGIRVETLDKLGERLNSTRPILLVDDSPTLEKLLTETLTRGGYTNITTLSNGKEAYDLLMEFKKTDVPISEFVHLIITDIEMPQMDGHRLLKLIKEDDVLKTIPVVIFSSLITDEMRIKGEKLGATAQLSKPEAVELVGIVDKVLERYKL